MPDGPMAAIQQRPSSHPQSLLSKVPEEAKEELMTLARAMADACHVFQRFKATVRRHNPEFFDGHPEERDPGRPAPKVSSFCDKWIRYIDDNTACAYFCNLRTGQVSWEEPEDYVTDSSAIATHLVDDLKSCTESENESLQGNKLGTEYKICENAEEAQCFETKDKLSAQERLREQKLEELRRKKELRSFQAPARDINISTFVINESAVNAEKKLKECVFVVDSIPKQHPATTGRGIKITFGMECLVVKEQWSQRGAIVKVPNDELDQNFYKVQLPSGEVVDCTFDELRLWK